MEVLFVVAPTPLAHVSNFLGEASRRAGRSLDLDMADQWKPQERTAGNLPDTTSAVPGAGAQLGSRILLRVRPTRLPAWLA